MVKTVTIVCVIIATFVTLAFAETEYVSIMTARYNIPANSKLNSCNTCHAFPNRNAYGLQLEAAGSGSDLIAAFAATDTLDADNDGANNEVELRNGTWPADPGDTAPVEDTTWGRLKALFKK